ncbi:hypothetical protein JRQ81_000295 [Phrynocephalus forsythii]|uniref:Reverse transcriptase/retrotransposon-derived protein RNase H-like domain-containing protein n=1 Tax=Phrynocephalus forsythii TaxID=171643 RepID=A0A9Q0Y505_9SAUR|nr:hypothetical protein JRQ81_000295 [Phrynocephalus forsythii]
MNDVNYIIQQGEEGQQVIHINMLKPYQKMESWALYAIREDPKEPDELLCWEGRGEPQFNLGGGVSPYINLDTEVRDWCIPNFSEVATPLTELAHKKQPEKVKWMTACQQSFDALKEDLATGPVLMAPNYDWEFTIFTDASDIGIGAVLCQPRENNHLRPVKYVSKKLLPGEKHLSIIEKHCLAIMWALQKLKPYIWGRKFVLCTDHSPLLWLKTMRTNSKLIR